MRCLRVFGHLRVLADEIAPPRVVAEILAPKTEYRVELDRDPACLVAPVLEDRLSGLQEFFGEGRVEALEPGQEDDGVAAGAGDRDGVELEITEALDDPVRRSPRPLAAPRGAPGHPGPLRFEQAGAAQRQPPGGADTDGFGHAFDGVP